MLNSKRNDVKLIILSLLVFSSIIQLSVTLALDTQRPVAVLKVLGPSGTGLTIPYTVHYGEDFYLSARDSSDPGGGSIAMYHWSYVSGSGGGNLDSLPDETVSPDHDWLVHSAITPKVRLGTHVFQLIVEDASGNMSPPTQATLEVVDTQNPVAVLTAPSKVILSQSFTLSGKGSADLGPGIAKYHWSYAKGPGGATVTPLPAETADPRFDVVPLRGRPLLAGTHVFQLIVEDTSGNRSPPAQASVQITSSSFLRGLAVSETPYDIIMVATVLLLVFVYLKRIHK